MIWGTTFVVSDTALASMSPAALTVTRFVLALLVLAPVAMTRGGIAAAIRSPAVAVLGATGVAAYYGLQNLGLVTTGAGTAAVRRQGSPSQQVSLPGYGWASDSPAACLLGSH
jgi:drug/metabolite transporter (DMT)-like permease